MNTGGLSLFQTVVGALGNNVNRCTYFARELDYTTLHVILILL